jgi:hypothetical protein
MFNRKKLQRDKESLEAELIEAHATIRMLRKRLRKREEQVKSSRDEKKARNAPRLPRFKYTVHGERKFVYLWIHKVACSSVKATLLPLFDLDPTPFEKTLKDGTRHFVVHQIFNASDYLRTQSMGPTGLMLCRQGGAQNSTAIFIEECCPCEPRVLPEHAVCRVCRDGLPDTG